MNHTKRTELIERIKQIGLPDGGSVPLVTLEEFFEGNDDYGSIGCNLIEHPGIPFFYDELRKIRDRENVSSVLIGVREVVEEDETMWPFSDTVYLTTSEDPMNVFDWFAPLQPDSVGPDLTGAENLPDAPDGHELCVAWWD